MNTFLPFHHIGLLTDQLELAGQRLEALGYVPGKPIYDPEQDVTLSMCKSLNNAPLIELVMPSPTNQALSRLLKRKGDYMYHICFVTPTIREGLAILQGKAEGRIVEVMPPKPAILFNYANVAFYSVPGLGLIELLEQGG